MALDPIGQRIRIGNERGIDQLVHARPDNLQRLMSVASLAQYPNRYGAGVCLSQCRQEELLEGLLEGLGIRIRGVTCEFAALLADDLLHSTQQFSVQVEEACEARAALPGTL
jgi:hypothetical protein